GADGAGKTTTCRVLVGLVAPDQGTVMRPPRERLGYQPEAAGTWADLTVGENLRFIASGYGLAERAKTRIDQLLEVTGLQGAWDRPAAMLSGGMRQKLAVAMAILADPELVVLDEPTTGLDPVSRSELWRLLLRAAGEGMAVLTTTSYLNEAERADHVVLLDEGQVLASGTADSIREGFSGAVVIAHRPPPDARSWRRGSAWHVWHEDGSVPEGAQRVSPDLEDVVTAAAMARKSAS
ncbi:MAG: ABC transporter ATP-binding protein, partial [Acidimicrobiia bacterium]